VASIVVASIVVALLVVALLVVASIVEAPITGAPLSVSTLVLAPLLVAPTVVEATSAFIVVIGRAAVASEALTVSVVTVAVGIASVLAGVERRAPVGIPGPSRLCIATPGFAVALVAGSITGIAGSPAVLAVVRLRGAAPLVVAISPVCAAVALVGVVVATGRASRGAIARVTIVAALDAVVAAIVTPVVAASTMPALSTAVVAPVALVEPLAVVESRALVEPLALFTCAQSLSVELGSVVIATVASAWAVIGPAMPSAAELRSAGLVASVALAVAAFAVIAPALTVVHSFVHRSILEHWELSGCVRRRFGSPWDARSEPHDGLDS